jgi:transposase
VVDGEGVVVRRDVVASDPEVLAKWLKRHCPSLVRVVLETGALSTFLYHGLIERDVPAVCICARHARKALSARVNKSDANDAESLAQLSRTGWFKAVHMKAEGTHIDRAALKVREQLVKSRNACANQLRGLLKLFGLRLGQVTTPGKRAERLAALFAQKPELKPVMTPLIQSLEALEAQIGSSAKQLTARAAADPVTTRLMSVPGVGPIAALTYVSSIEDPARFARPPAQPVGRARLQGPDIEGRRSDVAARALRGCQQPAGAGQTTQRLAELGQGDRRNKRPQACPRGGRAQARHPAPPPLAIGNRVQLGLTHAGAKTEGQYGRSRLCCRGSNRVGDTGTPTSPRLTAIMRHGHHASQASP